jgi:outer membrane biosynthesis protein TonB
MTDLPSASRVVWTASFLAAVAAHAGLVPPWLWREPDALAGAGGRELDAISFILADPGVLETRQVELAMPALPAPANAVEEYEGSTQENEPKKEESKELQDPVKSEHPMREPHAVMEAAEPKRQRNPSHRSAPSPAGRRAWQCDHREEGEDAGGGKCGQHSRVRQGGLAGRLPRQSRKALERWASSKFGLQFPLPVSLAPLQL